MTEEGFKQEVGEQVVSSVIGNEREETQTPHADKEHMFPPARTSTEPPKQLCGYLMKQSLKLPLKTWKTRWFVFDEKRCCLYYYNERNDFNPQGKIDISMATLSYEIENRSKNQFEILSEGQVISLQASSNEAMMYWLTQLQGKRRRHSVLSHQNPKSCEPDQPVPVKSTGGLVGGSSQENILSPNTEETALSNPLAPINPPADLEDRGAFVSEQSSGSHRSFSDKIRRFTRNRASPGSVRKPQAKGPLRPPPEEQDTVANGGTVHDESQYAINSELSETQDNKPARWNRKSIGSFWKRPDTVSCTRCQELQTTISSLEKELEMKEREVSDRDEINEFLRNEIRMTDLRDKAKQELTEGDSRVGDNRVDVLIQREQTIVQLEKLLGEAIGDRDRANTELEAKRQELSALGEQVALFKEALVAKDHVVVELTNTVFKLEHGGQIPNDPQEVMMPMSTKSHEAEIHKLEETVEAYKQQNRFLSSELVELNTVRSQDGELHKALENKYHDLEAEYLRIKSKHMVLLQESQSPRMGSELGPDIDVVSQMLEEALNTNDKNVPAMELDSHDRYGFSHTHAASDGGCPMDPLTIKARKLDQQAQRVHDDAAASKRERWEILLASGRELQRSEELKRLIRGGIPHTHRSQLWKWMVKDRLGREYNEGQYQAILAKHTGQPSIAVNQIELDLLRTLPTNKYYDSPQAQGIDKLRRILVAFSWYNQDVGYCQGLNRLAAIALLFLDEEDAFWCLVDIVHHLLPQDYYSHTLLGSQTDQRVLMDLLQDHANKLYQHLSICDIDLSMITFNWFHTIFVDNLPVETMLRIWDTFLYEGSKVLFRFAIAIFKYNEVELLNLENSIGIFNRLRAMCQDATDVNKIAQIAFNQIGRFPMKTITQKRNVYRQEIRSELNALDKLRSSHTPSDATKYVKRQKEDREDSGSETEETIFLPLNDSHHS